MSAVKLNMAEVAAHLVEAHRDDPQGCLGRLTEGFAQRRQVDLCGTLAMTIALLEEMAKLEPAEGLRESVRTVMAALEAAAPPPSGMVCPSDRTNWFLALWREARIRVEHLLPPLYAARLALEANLLSHVSPEELNELAPRLASTFPRNIAELLVSDDLPESAVIALLRTCRDGLLGKDLGGEDWDFLGRPELWDLASRVAVQAARMLADRGATEASSDLAWLLWGASRMVSAQGSLATEEPCRRLAEALDILITAYPVGMADVVLWAVYRFQRFGAGFPLSLERWMQLRRRAWEDARASSHEDLQFAFFLVKAAYLDRSLMFQDSVEADSVHADERD